MHEMKDESRNQSENSKSSRSRRPILVMDNSYKSKRMERESNETLKFSDDDVIMNQK